jgi:hypothetical protein
MLILGLILFGMLIGAGAQLILGREDGPSACSPGTGSTSAPAASSGRWSAPSS